MTEVCPKKKEDKQQQDPKEPEANPGVAEKYQPPPETPQQPPPDNSQFGSWMVVKRNPRKKPNPKEKQKAQEQDEETKSQARGSRFQLLDIEEEIPEKSEVEAAEPPCMEMGNSRPASRKGPAVVPDKENVKKGLQESAQLSNRDFGKKKAKGPIVNPKEVNTVSSEDLKARGRGKNGKADQTNTEAVQSGIKESSLTSVKEQPTVTKHVSSPSTDLENTSSPSTPAPPIPPPPDEGAREELGVGINGVAREKGNQRLQEV